MGRFPQLNSRAGKEHWTFTSAMMIGSGVRGGQSIGAFDQYCFGQNVDLISGEVHNSGEALVPGHLGATLLTLAGIDPQNYTQNLPIMAALL